MTNRIGLSLVLVGMALSSVATADELESGVAVDGSITSYKAIKCAGIDDGVAVGKSLCYTWRLGKSPVAFIFATKADDTLAGLVKQLDAIVAANEEAKMAAVVNFIDLEAEEIEQFAEKHEIKNVAFTAVDAKNSERFSVNPEAELTVMHYKGKRVLSNHAIAPGQLNDKAIKAIVDGTAEILAAEEEAPKKKDKKKSEKKKKEKKEKKAA